MGTPIRTVIRDAIAAAVSNPTLVPSIAGRVKKQRSHALGDSDLDLGNWLVVRMGDESVDEQGEYPRPRTQFVRMAIEVVAVARDNTDVDAVVDQIIAECRAAVFSDVTAGGNATDIVYSGIQDYGSDEENLDVVAAPMRFVATYATPENAADTPL